jgi:hypothetical protein
MKSILALCFALLITEYSHTYGRGQVPPPPLTATPPGGNIGDWLPSGPIWGFEEGGGSNGGWGGGFFGGGGSGGGGGWNGWGDGSGGSNGGYHGHGGSGNNGWGHLHDTLNRGRKPSEFFGTCYKMMEIGQVNRCDCQASYDPLFPPCDGCPVHGICRVADEVTGSNCDAPGELCSGGFHLPPSDDD